MQYVLVPGHVFACPRKRNPHAQRNHKFSSSRLDRFVKVVANLSRRSSSHAQPLVTDTADVRLTGQPTIRTPGLQLLATCKQAYDEGHHMLYNLNTFHWPPDPHENTPCWYKTLQPEHQKMIKTICVDLDFVDLMYGGMDAVESRAKKNALVDDHVIKMEVPGVK